MRLRSARRIASMLQLYNNWATALLNRTGVRNAHRTIEYRLRNGISVTMMTGRHDVRVLNEIFIDRVYEPTTDFVPAARWNVIDAGAHKGSFTLSVASRFPEARVLAVEPMPSNFDLLAENVRRNHCENVVLMRSGLASRTGTASFTFDPDSSGTGSMYNADGSPEAVDVETITLDDILRSVSGDVDLLKLDIEGAELSVLESASAAALGRVKRLVLEYHATDELDKSTVARKLATLLERKAFRPQIDSGRSLMWAVANDPVSRT